MEIIQYIECVFDRYPCCDCGLCDSYYLDCREDS